MYNRSSRVEAQMSGTVGAARLGGTGGAARLGSTGGAAHLGGWIRVMCSVASMCPK